MPLSFTTDPPPSLRRNRTHANNNGSIKLHKCASLLIKVIVALLVTINMKNMIAYVLFNNSDSSVMETTSLFLANNMNVVDMPSSIRDLLLLPTHNSEESEEDESTILQSATAISSTKLNESPLPLPSPIDGKSPNGVKKKVLGSTRQSVKPPVFVLSLPNSGSLTLDRYFKCAGFTIGDTLGRSWTPTGMDKEVIASRLPIGKCMMRNLNRNVTKDPLHNCGDFEIWMDMEFIQKNPLHYHRFNQTDRKCFFPALKPGALQQLLTRYPQATVINVMEDPEVWYDTLYQKTTTQRWSYVCNPSHNYAFPTSPDARDEWIRFYQDYNRLLQEEIQQYPSVNFIQIDFTQDATKTGLMLQQQLGIESTCWTDVAVDNTKPRDIRLPVLVASLPKSATSAMNYYLNCGLGAHEGAHQWTRHEAAADKDIPVGLCMQDNINKRVPVLEQCGDHTHWADIGAMDSKNQRCFYPSMHGNALEAFYEAHPYGTIVNTVRNARKWYESALKWRDLPTRWSKLCDGFPRHDELQTNATKLKEWTAFYEWHSRQLREFAQQHPTMTYVEFSIDDPEPQVLQTLDESFGFSPNCWIRKNDNTNGTALQQRVKKPPLLAASEASYQANTLKVRREGPRKKKKVSTRYSTNERQPQNDASPLDDYLKRHQQHGNPLQGRFFV